MTYVDIYLNVRYNKCLFNFHRFSLLTLKLDDIMQIQLSSWLGERDLSTSAIKLPPIIILSSLTFLYKTSNIDYTSI